jgi:3-oxoacyl-(acyl-carrier-protein) synthase
LKKILITGMGIVSSMGRGVEQHSDALTNRRSGIKDVKRVGGLPHAYWGGELDQSVEEILTTAGIDTLPADLSRSTALAMSAIQDLLSSTNFIDGKGSGLINATSVGGMDTTEQEYLKDREGWDYSKFLQHNLGQINDQILNFYDWNLYNTTLSTACSSAANALMLGARMIRSGKYDRIIVGGTDALSNFTMRGFESLMIYDRELCRPFDDTRAGLNLGEGAAYVLLESEESALKSGNTPLACLTGWANANDAFHATASSPEGKGAVLSMSAALKCAGLRADEIDYINAHGTATPNNDLSESVAIQQVFDPVPPFSSTKGFTGHTLAAAGAIEAVFSVMSIRQGKIWPNLNFKTPLNETGLSPQTELIDKEVKHVLSNSFGFGGNNSTVIFSAL